MSWWRRWRFAWFCWIAWLFGTLVAPGRASAFTLHGTADSALSIDAARVVIAAHGDRSTIWVQWIARATGSRVVALIPLASGSRLDPGDLDWFAAIEAATAPRILPPTQAELPDCAEAGAMHDTTSIVAAEVAHPAGVTWLDDAASLVAFARDAGFDLDHVPAFADSGDTDAFVAVDYSVLKGVPFLVGLRLDEPTAIEAWLDRFGALGSSERVPLTLTVLAPSAVVFSGQRIIYPEALSPVWRPRSGDSNYIEARAAFFDAEPDAWLTEGVGQTQLFTPYFPDALAEVPSIVNAFRERLEARGHDCPDWSAWLEDARTDDARVPLSCAQGTLGGSGAASCDSADPLSSPLACGEIDDLALALSGARPGSVVLTRHVGLLPARVALASADDAVVREHTVKVYAARTADCEGEIPKESADGTGGAKPATAATGSGGKDSVGGGGGSTSYPIVTSGGWEGSGSTGTGGSEWYGPVERRDDDDPEAVAVVAVQTGSCSCTDTSSSSEGSCSGSSSSGNGDATCSGDSSSDQESGDDTCSGDSSSDSSGDTCGGSSSGEAEGETCSGGSEGGDATCSGSSGGDGCAVGQLGLPRPRLSVLTMLLGAGLLPLRRSRRRPR